MRTLHVVVPEGIDDPQRPSGGNVYDRRICTGLTELGWSVHEHAIPGAWPSPDERSSQLLHDAVASLADDDVVLVDGLIASTSGDVLIPQFRRVRGVVLVHMPIGEHDAGARPGERETISSAAAVVATSEWTRAWLRDAYAIGPERVHVIEPGVDAADVATGTRGGGRLLTVGAVTHLKGHDIIIRALADLSDRQWTCTFVGATTREPGYVSELGKLASRAGLSDRVHLVGPRVGNELGAAYASSDVLIHMPRAETYGMVVTEALAHGLPVIASDVGGIRSAMGQVPDGGTPGLLVAADDPAAATEAIRRWLDDSDLRRTLQTRALVRRATLRGWSEASRHMAHVVAGVAA